MSLHLYGVTKRVGAETHIHELSLTLEPGTLTVLLGRTLAGKTSLMRLMAGLDQAQIDHKVRAAAEMLRIDPFLKRLPSELSGGQQQRTAIARALVKEAKLLLLDDPLVNLYYKLREELRSELKQIFARSSTMVVYATTEPLEALIMGGNTVVLHGGGRLLQTGSTVEVFNKPATTVVGAVFSDPPTNFLKARVGADGIVLDDGTILPLEAHDSALSAGPCIVGLRANHLSVARRSER